MTRELAMPRRRSSVLISPAPEQPGSIYGLREAVGQLWCAVADSENSTYNLRDVGGVFWGIRGKEQQYALPARGRVTTAKRDFPFSEPAFA